MKISVFPHFRAKIPTLPKGSGAKVQNVFSLGRREGIFDHLFGYFRPKMTKMGYFRDLPIRAFPSKAPRKLRAILENLTIREK